MKISTLTLIASLSLGVSSAFAADAFSLEQLLSLSQNSNKGVAAAHAGVDAASAAVTSAGAYPNPQVEMMYGRLRGRQAGVAEGNTPSFSITQRLDYPQQRSLRRSIAERNLDATEAGLQAFYADLAGRVKTGYFGVLRRESELAAAREDLAMMKQVHSRARLRVEVGEAPRYELIRAETELLAAQKSLQSAEYRVDQAKAALRQQVGGALPPKFALAGSLGQIPNVPDLAVMRERLSTANAELVQRRMELERANLAVDYQRSLRLPELAVRASTTREPDNSVSQVGLVLTIPLWDRRKGPVGEAVAQATQARNAYELREFELAQELESAYRQLEITQAQVTALESGIVREAENALQVAQAAYRYGERGILEVIDAQRTLRNARNELIAAQYDQQMAVIQIERLLSMAPGMTQPGVTPGRTSDVTPDVSPAMTPAVTSATTPAMTPTAATLSTESNKD
ncbi:TolC family protein [Cupriavidus gilardii]|uniref:TolC family protein n=1 Tax=Cupriavidus gilardii TaxID=82541 RepID=UPI0021C09BBD|nr:TolC family protein [Cupriavidus gilardii]MCT9118154.1 TolC family protein [Cupriavidus gilardii]